MRFIDPFAPWPSIACGRRRRRYPKIPRAARHTIGTEIQLPGKISCDLGRGLGLPTRETNISYLGKKKIIFKHAICLGGYVSSLDITSFQRVRDFSASRKLSIYMKKRSPGTAQQMPCNGRCHISIRVMLNALTEKMLVSWIMVLAGSNIMALLQWSLVDKDRSSAMIKKLKNHLPS